MPVLQDVHCSRALTFGNAEGSCIWQVDMLLVAEPRVLGVLTERAFLKIKSDIFFI
jgi:hypothetical protein